MRMFLLELLNSYLIDLQAYNGLVPLQKGLIDGYSNE